MPVYVKKMDNIVGMIHLRQLLLKPDSSLDRLVQPVQFVPEQKTVESLLEYFRKTGTDMAVVVDEYGGIAGSVRLEDIAEELFGRMEQVSGVEPIKQLGPFQYRLAGDLAIHDWADVLGSRSGGDPALHDRRARDRPARQDPPQGRRRPHGKPEIHRGSREQTPDRDRDPVLRADPDRTDNAMIVALILTLVTVILSAVFSGLETGIYRMSRLRLRLGAERGDLRYVLLSKAMRDGSALLLTLLVANNLVNYLATSSVTYLFLAVAPDQARRSCWRPR